MFKRLIIFVVTLLAAAPALAQSVPDPINAALADLSTRVNRTVTLNQVTGWNYQQSVYPSPALGCPQPGVAYADVLTSGYQFIITYEQTVYDYRVSDDKSIVVLCGTAPAPESVPPCPPPNDNSFITPRLSKDIKARVVAGGEPNVIREQPGSSSKLLGQIPPGDSFLVIDGPRCTLLDKIVWWQINYNNIIGWTGEGQNGTYWLEPEDVALTPTAETTPAAEVTATTVPQLENVTITTSNAAQLSADMTIDEPFALSADGTLYAVMDGNIIKVINIKTQATTASFDNINPQITSFAFNPAGTMLAAGTGTGEILLFDLKATSSTFLDLRTGKSGAINLLAFNADGSLLASLGNDDTLRVWDTSAEKAALVSLTLSSGGQVTGLSFTADSIHLIAHDSLGKNTIYSVKLEAVG